MKKLILFSVIAVVFYLGFRAHADQQDAAARSHLKCEEASADVRAARHLEPERVPALQEIEKIWCAPWVGQR